MNTIQLKNIYLSDEMMTAGQISSYTEKTFIHKDGTFDVGQINLSGNVNIGGDTSCILSNSNVIGFNCSAGTRCFTVYSFDQNTNIVSVDSIFGIEPGMKLSYKLDYNYDAYSIVLSVISDTQLSVDRVLTEFTELDIQALNDKIAHIWIADHPEIGSTDTYEGYATAIGYGTTAQAFASFAEGYNNKSIGRNSHSEGKNNTVYAFAGHAEGLGNEVMARYSHAEGGYNKAIGQGNDDYVHAEGWMTSAYAQFTHTEGAKTAAYGSFSHAEGCKTKAFGQAQHVEGCMTSAYGDYSHTEGYSTVASCMYSHAEGNGSLALNIGSHAENSSTACGEYSHAEGMQTSAYGYYSHAEGNHTLAHGHDSHVEGKRTMAKGVCSHAAGISAVTDADYSFVWNGNHTSPFVVENEKTGTFNVNPVNGLSGFYVGNKNISEHIKNECVTQVSSQLSNAYVVTENGQWYKGGILYPQKMWFIAGSALSSSIVKIEPDAVLCTTTQRQDSVQYYNILSEKIDPSQLVHGESLTNCFLGLYGKALPNAASFISNDVVNMNDILSIYPTAKYIVVNKYINNGVSISVDTPFARKLERCVFLEIPHDYGTSKDYLYGKTYTALGDSYTQYGPCDTYVKYIADRNNMKLQNLAISGSKLYRPAGETWTEDCFMERLYSDNVINALSTADYITIAYGCNDTSAAIGNIDSSDIHTYMGAWNTLLSTVLSVNPGACVGIIINDGAMCGKKAVYDAIISAAEYWGIPYLDMLNDVKVPAMLNYDSNPGRANKMNLYAVSQRRAIFDAKDAEHPTGQSDHPGIIGQKYRSRVIENFMRSL